MTHISRKCFLESEHFQTSADDIRFCEILTTNVLSVLEIFFENALYKFTLYLLTDLLTRESRRERAADWLTAEEVL